MITKDMIISEVIREHPQTVAVLQGMGIGCVGCIAASSETLEQGLSAHGVDIDEVVKKMNEAIGA
jgi:hybrid cluster-associated redox disulfide protein